MFSERHIFAYIFPSKSLWSERYCFNSPDITEYGYHP